MFLTQSRTETTERAEAATLEALPAPKPVDEELSWDDVPQTDMILSLIHISAPTRPY